MRSHVNAKSGRKLLILKGKVIVRTQAGALGLTVVPLVMTEAAFRLLRFRTLC